MHIHALKKLFLPLSKQFRKEVPVLTESGEVVFTLRVSSSSEDAEISRMHSDFINDILKEFAPFVKMEADGSVKLKFDPTIAEMLQARMDSALESIRSYQSRKRISYAVIAVAGQEIPPVVTLEDGSQVSRADVVFDILSDLPSGLVDYLLVEYRELVSSSTISYFNNTKVSGDVDAEIEIAKQQFEDIQSKRQAEMKKIRNQVEEVAQNAAESVDEEEDAIPPEALFRFEEERQKFEAEKVAPAPAPPQEPKERVSLATQVEVKPVTQTPVQPPQKGQISTITENGVEIPVYSIGEHVITAEEPSPVTPPANPRHSVNPRFRPIPGRIGQR